ncbi:hypothetical protein AWB81_07885 [Caballeronia arationis]|jgi:hypothetical protein|nr:hypothetical protein AWB81_07885 [Caballeronia arationis]
MSFARIAHPVNRVDWLLHGLSSIRFTLIIKIVVQPVIATTDRASVSQRRMRSPNAVILAHGMSSLVEVCGERG